jgi:hypothetical protein
VKKTTAIFALTVFSLAIFLPLLLNTKTASAQDSYTIQNIDHQVAVMYSGHIVIRDTIQVTGQITNGFLIGFPNKYGAHVLKGIAYDANNIFPISLGVQLGNRSLFYAAEITFPQGSPQVFTVVFILSNDLISQDLSTGVFNLDFPAYPSLTQEAARCNVTFILPDLTIGVTITKDDGVTDTPNYVKDNLDAYTYSPAKAAFIPAGTLQTVEIKELNRIITTSPTGETKASDTYRVANNEQGSIGSLEISVPLTASNIVGRDEFGRSLSAEILSSSTTYRILLVNITFILPLEAGDSTLLTAEYTLPSISPEQTTQFTLNLDLFPYFNYYVDKASVTIIPPEGARFLTPQFASIDPSQSLSREIFQETLSINRESVSYVDLASSSENALQITYDYNSLWLSFRPTLWAWALAVAGCVIVAVWRRPKTSAPQRIVVPKASINLSPDHVRAFIDAYEEKNRIASELKSLEVRAQKGKIPRRQYKVQRGTWESRSEALSKNIAELKRLLRSAGGSYADLIRQLDIAENEFNEVEMNIRRVEARFRGGALSLEDYKKFLADYQKRKEKTETTVNGILLRLREEIH